MLRAMSHPNASGPGPDPVADVTVIVVAYNHQDFVVECLDSIRTQTTRPARVLIADDASPDATAAVIRAYLVEHPHAGELHASTVNKGLNRTLNAMLALVSTEFVTYIAADDYMLPPRIERHTELLRNAPAHAVLAYSDAIVVDEHGAIRDGSSRTEFPWPEEPRRSHATQAELVERNWIPAASFFLRTAELKRAGGYLEGIFFEDYELLLRLSRDHTFVYTQEPLVAVRRLSTSLGATGFVTDSPRFIRASYAALSNAVGRGGEAEQLALPKVWELARRATAAGLPRSERIRMAWESRGGAPTPGSLAKGLVQAVTASAQERQA